MVNKLSAACAKSSIISAVLLLPVWQKKSREIEKEISVPDFITIAIFQHHSHPWARIQRDAKLMHPSSWASWLAHLFPNSRLCLLIDVTSLHHIPPRARNTLRLDIVPRVAACRLCDLCNSVIRSPSLCMVKVLEIAFFLSQMSSKLLRAWRGVLSVLEHVLLRLLGNRVHGSHLS